MEEQDFRKQTPTLLQGAKGGGGSFILIAVQVCTTLIHSWNLSLSKDDVLPIRVLQTDHLSGQQFEWGPHGLSRLDLSGRAGSSRT